MPAYTWTCHACGETNSRHAGACAACACPAEATAAAIAAHRSAFVAGGGDSKGTAAQHADTELGAFDVLVRPVVWALSGAWLPRLDKPGADRR